MLQKSKILAETVETVEVVTRWEKGKATTYSLDGGKTWLSRQDFKQEIGPLKRPLYNNSKKKKENK